MKTDFNIEYKEGVLSVINLESKIVIPISDKIYSNMAYESSEYNKVQPFKKLSGQEKKSVVKKLLKSIEVTTKALDFLIQY